MLAATASCLARVGRFIVALPRARLGDGVVELVRHPGDEAGELSEDIAVVRVAVVEVRVEAECRTACSNRPRVQIFAASRRLLAAREVNVDERETQVTAEREAVAADLEKRRALAAELAHLRDEAAREKSATDEQRAARDVLVRELVVLDGKLADKRGELGDLDEREAAVEAFEKGKRALEVEYRRDFSVPNFAQGVVSVLRWHNIEPPDRLMAAFVRTAETASPHPVVELSAEMAREESRKRRGGPERRDGREEGIGSG